MILLFTRCQKCRFFRRRTGDKNYECAGCFYDRYERKMKEDAWSEEHQPAARGILELVFILGLVLWAMKILLSL